MRVLLLRPLRHLRCGPRVAAAVPHWIHRHWLLGCQPTMRLLAREGQVRGRARRRSRPARHRHEAGASCLGEAAAHEGALGQAVLGDQPTPPHASPVRSGPRGRVGDPLHITDLRPACWGRGVPAVTPPGVLPLKSRRLGVLGVVDAAAGWSGGTRSKEHRTPGSLVPGVHLGWLREDKRRTLGKRKAKHS